MSYAATARFRCDGCKVVESDPIEIPSDMLQAQPPFGWLRVETLKRSHDLDVHGVKHFCRFCAKSVENYLAGRRIEDEERTDAHGR